MQRRGGNGRLRADVLAEAIGAVRDLDAAHLRRVGAVRGEFYAELPPHERPVIAGHRAEVAALLDGAAAWWWPAGTWACWPTCCTCSTSRRRCGHR